MLNGFTPNLHHAGILHLPADVLILVFSLLHGQDIARCARVCRCFSDLIVSSLSLQYRIELARNGLVDGDSNTLPLAERLERLRRYSSKFCTGDFDHKDISDYPEYADRVRYFGRKPQVPGGSPLSVMYESYKGGILESFLSVFAPGSTQAGIPSILCLLPIEERVVRNWAIDYAQDLLVTVEWADVAVSGPMLPRLEEVNFYSLSGSKTTRTPHPAATLPSVVVSRPDGIDPRAEVGIFKICVSGEYVLWELDQWAITRTTKYSIDVWDWMTGQSIKKIYVGCSLVNFALFDDRYVVVTAKHFAPSVDIYSFSRSAPDHRLCALEIPQESTGEFRISCQISTGERPATSAGHFRADPSLSLVSVSLHTGDMQREYASVFLIPHATILAQIHTAENRKPEESTDEWDAERFPGEWEAVRVPWADWGPHGCLRLQLQLPHRSSRVALLPCGSRAPVVAFPGCADFKTDSIFVFDVNPLAARRAKHLLATRREQSELDHEEMAIVEDVEDVLPGVVDPECSTIPYVVYRFKLPYADCSTDSSVGGRTIRAVEMSMTGFTIKFDGVGLEESLQTWTV